MAKKRVNKEQYRHHHTPAFYYRNFIPKGSNVFRVFDIQTGKHWPDNGQNTGFEQYLHDVGRTETFPDGRTVNRLEDFFHWSEDQASPIYKRWIAEERIHSQEDVVKMCAHFVLLFLRNPEQLQTMTNIKVKGIRERVNDSSISIYLDKKDAFWEGLESDKIFMEFFSTFLNMRYSLFKSNDIEFITNDNSVIPIHSIYQDTSDLQELRMPTTFLHSICPQLCFMLDLQNGSRVLGKNVYGEETRSLNAHGVEQFNKAIIQRASRHVVSSSYNAHVYELVRDQATLRGIKWR